MAQIPGTIRVTAPIAPSDSADVYPSHLSSYGKGSWREVSNLTERDSISGERRSQGMSVWVVSEQKLYILKNGITNLDWVEFTTGLTPVPQSNIVIVDNAGNDSTGTVGDLAKPFATYSAAVAAISGQSLNNQFCIKFTSGEYFFTSMLLKPFINLTCETLNSASIHVTNGINLDPIWHDTYSAGITLQNLSISGDTSINLNLNAIDGIDQSITGEILLENIEIHGIATLYGRRYRINNPPLRPYYVTPDVFVIKNCTNKNEIRTDCCTLYNFQSNSVDGFIGVYGTLGPTSVQNLGSRIADYSQDGSGSYISNSIFVGCYVTGMLELNGISANVRSDSSSLCDASISLLGGATIDQISYDLDIASRIRDDSSTGTGQNLDEALDTIRGSIPSAGLPIGPYSGPGLIPITDETGNLSVKQAILNGSFNTVSTDLSTGQLRINSTLIKPVEANAILTANKIPVGMATLGNSTLKDSQLTQDLTQDSGHKSVISLTAPMDPSKTLKFGVSDTTNISSISTENQTLEIYNNGNKTATCTASNGVNIIGNISAANYTVNQSAAVTGSNSPSALNVFATMADVGSGVTFETSPSNIKMDGTVSVGTLSTIPRADHIHPRDTTKFDKTGGTITGPVTINSPDSTTPVVDISVTIADQFSSGESNPWQSFTPTISGNLSTLKIYAAAGTYYPTLKIFKGIGTSGELLHSQPVTIGINWSTLSINSPVLLQAGIDYTWELYGGTYQMRYGFSYPHASSMGGSRNFCFETYMSVLALNVIESGIFSGFINAQSVREKLTEIVTTASTITLTDDSNPIYRFTGSTPGQIITLPNSTIVPIGYRQFIVNDSSVSISVRDNLGNILTTLKSGTACIFHNARGVNTDSANWTVTTISTNFLDSGSIVQDIPSNLSNSLIPSTNAVNAFLGGYVPSESLVQDIPANLSNSLIPSTNAVNNYIYQKTFYNLSGSVTSSTWYRVGYILNSVSTYYQTEIEVFITNKTTGGISKVSLTSGGTGITVSNRFNISNGSISTIRPFFRTYKNNTNNGIYYYVKVPSDCIFTISIACPMVYPTASATNTLGTISIQGTGADPSGSTNQILVYDTTIDDAGYYSPKIVNFYGPFSVSPQPVTVSFDVNDNFFSANFEFFTVIGTPPQAYIYSDPNVIPSKWMPNNVSTNNVPAWRMLAFDAGNMVEATGNVTISLDGKITVSKNLNSQFNPGINTVGFYNFTCGWSIKKT